MKKRALFYFLMSAILFGNGLPAFSEIHLDRLKLPNGFHVSVYASGIKGARSMAWGSKGTLFIGTLEAGNFYAVTKNKKVITLGTKRNMPNGVAFKDGALYLTEANQVLRYDHIEDHLNPLPKPVVINDHYPGNLHHGWKFTAFGPDGLLYIPIGAPCDSCEISDPFGSITRIDVKKKNQGENDKEIIARGIRNTVGFDWHPLTHELWFTDNGRDMMGEDLPSDELNHLSKPGQNFGFPYCHQGDTLDPILGKGKNCKDYTPPELKLGAHVASLGMRFYTGKQFPKAYQNQIFIAEHGSWNRSKKSGYRVVSVKLDETGHVKNQEVFLEGFMQDEKYWGRPVDVINAPDGSLLVSDDEAGAVYQISYSL